MFVELLQSTRTNDPEATLQLLELFKGDITRLSRFIFMPQEDAVAQIIVEFLEYVKQHE
ncbi:helix-turn-helix domain-containing protein [Paenibacillus filicis]|uniref:Helix-turn-helix domain-containing protein n=1 Tax=Paenibacillus filicis TaxID=669464 RepID=A0ABU9DNV8_9BACL